jgi:sterol desaturase/sphingolipid hydroxylase (fatty acid hydroxylase superfamily)
MEKPDYGITDEKGHWRPPYACSFVPLWEKPFKTKEVLKYIFGWGGYLWPQTLFYVGLAVVTWNYLQPAFETTARLSPGWMLTMLVRNVVMLVLINSFYHIVLYTLKLWGKGRKYNPNWPDKGNKKFLFNSQMADNIIWTTVSGGLIWTVYDILYMWGSANGITPLMTWEQNPVWFIAFLILIPIYRNTHFYFVHRFIHLKRLYKTVHAVHHRNINPGPWSGMSMHPLEHLLYFSNLFIHLIVPSHPIHFIMDAQHTALTPAGGHTGFEGPFLKGLYPVGSYFHYLHHKHVSSNFGTEMVPWDKILGRFYNGEGKYPFRFNNKGKVISG